MAAREDPSLDLEALAATIMEPQADALFPDDPRPPLYKRPIVLAWFCGFCLCGVSGSATIYATMRGLTILGGPIALVSLVALFLFAWAAIYSCAAAVYFAVAGACSFCGGQARYRGLVSTYHGHYSGRTMDKKRLCELHRDLAAPAQRERIR